MAKIRRKQTLTQRRRNAIRRIVILCARLERRDVSTRLIELITAHVAKALRKPLLRRLVEGDLGSPMLAAMKLAAPFFRA